MYSECICRVYDKLLNRVAPNLNFSREISRALRQSLGLSFKKKARMLLFALSTLVKLPDHPPPVLGWNLIKGESTRVSGSELRCVHWQRSQKPLGEDLRAQVIEMKNTSSEMPL